MNPNTITILFADDHAIVREGYRALLSKQIGMQVIAEATDGNQAYQLYKRYVPDIIIMDISMPGQSGLETIQRIKHRDSKAKILVFTMHQNVHFAEQALKAGALGYITKSSPPEQLLSAIDKIQLGHRVLSPDIAQTIALEKTQADYQNTLTAREFEILCMLAKAKTKQEIAHLLNISPKTVANSHYLIKNKLGVTSDIELAYRAIKMNVIGPEDILK